MKIKSLIVALFVTIACANTWAWDLSNLKGLNGVVNSLISTDKVEVSDLNGTWKSAGPAIVFKSENLLQKAGGTAAQAAIENKLQRYYKNTHLEDFSMTFDGQGNFTMNLKNGRSIAGTYAKGTTDGTMVFNFGKLNKSKLSRVTAYVQKGTQLSITFDMSKLNTLLTAVSKYSGNATLSTLTSLLNSYKGMYAGFKFDKK